MTVAWTGSSTVSAAAEPSEEDLLAAAYLSRVAEPAFMPLWLLVREAGYQDAAAAVRAGAVSPEVASGTEARRLAADPYVDLAAAQRHGIRLITPASTEWPHFAFGAMQRAALRRQAEWLAGRQSRPPGGELIPPLALWLRGTGELATVGVGSVAIVGSRAATAYGEHFASELGYGLARNDVVVVSGGAYGVDAAAHRGALAAGGSSVLVSAGGLDRPYPAGHRALYERTAEEGLLISERPPGSAPHRQRFLSRNRLIAALGAATVVVEAGQRSGALNTAGYAKALGRPLLAVPGPVTSAMSVGCHRLLQRDEPRVHLVTSVADVLEFCGRRPLPQDSPQPDDLSGYDRLGLSARTVLDAFPAGRLVAEFELSRLSGQPIGVVQAAVPALVSTGLVEASAGGFRLVQTGGSGLPTERTERAEAAAPAPRASAVSLTEPGESEPRASPTEPAQGCAAHRTGRPGFG
jgi:DNA processing protein